MSSRSAKWVVHQNADDTWSLSKGGRFYYEGLRTRPEALNRLRSYHKPGEPVFLEEPDGYRTNITQTLRKANLIR